MKKIFFLIVFSCICNAAYPQLTDGTLVPDFTFTDINGNTQNLYTYLDQGKYVALDVSATWCGPCWAYHNKRVIDSLYSKHDTPGDSTWKVIFIEGDPSTDSADLRGSGGNTQGDWVASSSYTIIDPLSSSALNNFITAYNIDFFPTLMLICPDKRVFQNTLNTPGSNYLSNWENVSLNCSSTGINKVQDDFFVNIYPNPAKDKFTVKFSLQTSQQLSLLITDITGKNIEMKNLGLLSASSHVIEYNIQPLPAGLYFLQLSGDTFFATRKIIVY